MCATNWPVAQAGLGSIQTPTLPFHLCLRPCSARPPLRLPLPLPCDGSRGLAGTAEFTLGFSSGPQHPRVDHGFSLTASCSNNLQLQFTDLGGAVSGCPRLSFHPAQILSLLSCHFGSSQCPSLFLAKYSRRFMSTVWPLSSPPNPNLQT